MPTPNEQTQDLAPESQEQQPTQEQLQAEWNAQATARAAGDNPAASVDTPTDEENQPAANEPPADSPAQAPDPIAQLAANQANILAELRRTQGKVSHLQSELAKSAAAAAAATPGKDGPTANQIADAIKDPEEWAQLKEDFPEWAVAMDKRLDQKIANAMKSAPGPTPAPAPDAAQIDDVVDQRVSQALLQREKLAIERRHPGWENTSRSPEFKAWFDAQPTEVKALAESEFSFDAIDLFDRFKKDSTGRAVSLNDQRRSRLTAAATTRPNGQVPKTRSFEELSPGEQWKAVEAERASKRQAA